jgi:hypothetical protein
MAAKLSLKAAPKTSVRIWRPIIDKLELKLEAACLRRDAFLARVLDTESAWLDREVSIANSAETYAFVMNRLDTLDRKLVTLALPPELTARINEICARKRIVRDAFFNRLFLLMAASPQLLDHLLFKNLEGDWRTDLLAEFPRAWGKAAVATFTDPLAPATDPFWAIREMLEEYSGQGENVELVTGEDGLKRKIVRNSDGTLTPTTNIYTTVFEQKIGSIELLGLSCYLPDWRIPGSAAATEKTNLDEMLLNEKDLL